MATSVNVKQSYGAGASGGQTWIIMNRYGRPGGTVRITVTGTVAYSVEGTIARLNRGETADPFTLDDNAGVPITAQTTTLAFLLSQVNLEAIRINQASGSGSLDFHVMQQGGSL